MDETSNSVDGGMGGWSHEFTFRWCNSPLLGAGGGRRYLLQLESFQHVWLLLLPLEMTTSLNQLGDVIPS